MSNVKKISDAEWEVMKVLWECSPQSANEIVAALAERPWSPATIRTLIGRLTKKGVLQFEKAGREYRYSPRVDKTECIRQARKSFIRRVYDGSAHPMLAQVIEEEPLSMRELDELHRLLDEKRKKCR